jgi:hypothetical protein
MVARTNSAHDFPRQYFRRALARGRLSHAYLFVGPEETEKERFALELAKMLFCESSSAGDAGPCENCPACRSVEHGNHVGVSIYGPVEGKRVIDIDTVRSICERSHFSRDHAFVAIVEGAHRMTVPAANALLKTLEEPAGEFILVLTAISTGSLLPTIVSRSHRIPFSSPHGISSADDLDVSGSLLERLDRGFFAREDPRRILAELDPDGENQRARVRRLLDECVERTRGAMTTSDAPHIDLLIDDQSLFLELRRALDGNVHADLVFEQLLGRLYRRYHRA